MCAGAPGAAATKSSNNLVHVKLLKIRPPAAISSYEVQQLDSDSDGDWHYAAAGSEWDDGTLAGLGRWWKRPVPRSQVARRAAAAADRLIVGNEVLADWGVQ